MITLIDASPATNLRLQLRFSDGREGIVDFHELIECELPRVFSALLDRAFFLGFDLRDGTLHWPGELDLAPEYLYFKAFEKEPCLQKRFADWGYINGNVVNA